MKKKRRKCKKKILADKTRKNLGKEKENIFGGFQNETGNMERDWLQRAEVGGVNTLNEDGREGKDGGGGEM